MDYTLLGRTGLRVSRLCLGTMNFGPTTDEKTSFKIMDKALDHAINIFDTANIFGFLAIILAAINIFGGFLVTQRMLQMYKKKKKSKNDFS